MKDLLNLILTNITTHPEDINITETNEGGQIVYTISVHPEDMGRVIGKSGKVIRAIRSIAHVAGIRKEERYRINVAEVDGNGAAASVDSGSDEEPEADMPAVETEDSADEELIAGAINLSEDESSSEE